VNITNYVKTSAAQPNDVVIYWGHDILYPMVSVGGCVYVCMAIAKQPSYFRASLGKLGSFRFWIHLL